jgi:type I restriction enzyme R subunit
MHCSSTPLLEIEVLTEDEEEAAKAWTKSRWAALEKLVGAAPRMETFAADLVVHFETRGRDAGQGDGRLHEP